MTFCSEEDTAPLSKITVDIMRICEKTDSSRVELANPKDACIE